MDSHICIEFTPTFHQYFNFCRSIQPRILRVLRASAYIGLLGFVLAPFLPSDENLTTLEKYGASIRLLILPALMLISFPLTMYFAVKKRWNVADELRERKVYEFSDAGISVKAGSFESSSSWSNFIKAETVGPTISIFNAQFMAHLIPVSAFSNSEDVAAFKYLLRSKIQNCKRL